VKWLEDKSAVDDLGREGRAFTGYGRNSLLRHWSLQRIRSLIDASNLATSLRDDLREDMVAYFKKLREFRTHYEQLRKINGEVTKLFDRETPGYFHSALADKRSTMAPPSEAGLTYEGLSRELQKLINRTRDPDLAAVSTCYIYESPFQLELGSGPQITSDRLFTPVKYMVSFWRRRTAEGTSDVADFLLARVIELLALRPE
jgi:hypothetical protein